MVAAFKIDANCASLFVSAPTFVQRVLEILSRIGERDEAIRRLIIIQNNPRPLTNSETRTL
jgi:hypothetical protein